MHLQRSQSQRERKEQPQGPRGDGAAALAELSAGSAGAGGAGAETKAHRGPGEVARGPALTIGIPGLLHTTGAPLNPAAFLVGPALGIFS